MTASRTRIALLMAASCLLLAGCGPVTSVAGATPATTTIVGTAATATSSAAAVGGGHGAGLRACDLITEKDASTAIGKDAGAGMAGGGAALSECIYSDGGLIVSLKTDSRELYTTSHTAAVAKGATEVPGVGDSAFAAGTDETRSCDFPLWHHRSHDEPGVERRSYLSGRPP